MLAPQHMLQRCWRRTWVSYTKSRTRTFIGLPCPGPPPESTSIALGRLSSSCKLPRRPHMCMQRGRHPVSPQGAPHTPRAVWGPGLGDVGCIVWPLEGRRGSQHRRACSCVVTRLYAAVTSRIPDPWSAPCWRSIRELLGGSAGSACASVSSCAGGRQRCRRTAARACRCPMHTYRRLARGCWHWVLRRAEQVTGLTSLFKWDN